MTVEIYKGKYVSAESAYNYIDADSIVSECQRLKELAGELARDSKKVMYSADYCSPNAFNVEGKTFDGKIEYCGKKVNLTANQIDDYANEILENLQKALDKKQTELNEIAQKEDQKLTLQMENVENVVNTKNNIVVE